VPCLVAEIGSLSLEFTRLSQLSGDPKFFDAIQRISDRFEESQSLSKLPGMWPVVVNPNKKDMGDDTFFTIGAMADSLYEYLPKVC
jgi:mannosyl-oligosaccharide alpha-1,2-mannosidase